MKNTIRVGTWNTEWAPPGAPRGNIISYKLAATDCEILCVTEGFAGILPDGGHVIDAGDDWGCPPKNGHRKVLWSKQPWTPHTHALGMEGCRSHKGRFVAGTTKTASGASLTFIGVCIPWRGSHVKYCKKNRDWWEDHKRWLRGVPEAAVPVPQVGNGGLGRLQPENTEGEIRAHENSRRALASVRRLSGRDGRRFAP